MERVLDRRRDLADAFPQDDYFGFSIAVLLVDSKRITAISSLRTVAVAGLPRTLIPSARSESLRF